MDRRKFINVCSAVGLAMTSLSTLFTKPVFAVTHPDSHNVDAIGGAELLATCPDICLQEIRSVLDEDQIMSIELDDLLYVLADATHLTYLSGTAAGNRSTQDAVEQALLAVPTKFNGSDKLLVMLTANQSFFSFRGIKNMQNSLVSRIHDTYFALSTTHNENMREGEARVGILVSHADVL